MNTPDYGHNGKNADGLWIMHPSGDLVSTEEKERRLALNAKQRRIKPAQNDILGMSWCELEQKQGGSIRFK